jgi:hypothetical protein
MKKTAFSLALIIGLAAGPAFAFQCPGMMAQIDEALQTVELFRVPFDSSAARVAMPPRVRSMLADARARRHPKERHADPRQLPREAAARRHPARDRPATGPGLSFAPLPRPGARAALVGASIAIRTPAVRSRGSASSVAIRTPGGLCPTKPLRTPFPAN